VPSVRLRRTARTVCVPTHPTELATPVGVVFVVAVHPWLEPELNNSALKSENEALQVLDVFVGSSKSIQ
jgi:hypothetical protein